MMVLLGFAIGTVGTLVGAGGGFLLVPILLFLFPLAGNEWIVAVSMFMVAFNATSGSVTYIAKKKVNVRAALVFIAASLPGALIGVWIERFVPRAYFEMIFATALIAYSSYLLVKAEKVAAGGTLTADSELSPKLMAQGAGISFLTAIAAAFLGIGGGVIHVPLLSQWLGFPVHLATGTSHTILACTAWIATIAHLWHGDISLDQPILWELGLGAVAGAQLGAFLSTKVSGKKILQILAVALLLVGLRIGLRHFSVF